MLNAEYLVYLEIYIQHISKNNNTVNHKSSIHQLFGLTLRVNH